MIRFPLRLAEGLAPSRLGLLPILFALLWCAPAASQWAWKDDSGRQVYSDRPPPPNIKPSQITQQPSRQVVAPTPSMPTASEDAKPAADAKAKAAPAPAAPKTLAERDMEFRKRQQETAENERKAAEEQQRAAAKAADCERARGYVKALEDGMRVQRTDANGNREYLDDSQRAAEIDRTRKVIQSSCS